jgi:hypothetical protein
MAKSYSKKVVLCGDLGPDYTKKGDDIHVIKQKAFASKSVWNTVKACVQKKSEIVLTKPTDFVSDEAWESFMSNLITPTDTNKKRLNILLKIDAKGVDLWLDDEMAFRNALKDIIENDKTVNSITYIKGIMSHVRQGLMAIGRQHAYGDGELMDILGPPLVHSGNPATKSTQDFFTGMIKKKTPKESAESRDKREGVPTSLGIVYFTQLYLLRQFIKDSRKINDPARLVNTLSLSLLLNFLMHEVSRPGDCYREMLHSHMFIPLHKRVYMLTFAFLKPSSFAYFLENELLMSYVQTFYKGKHMKQFLQRLKTTIPMAQNSLDLMVRYVITMRMILMIDPSMLAAKVFREACWIDRLRSLAILLGFNRFTFYGIRYAHAEEMNKGHIMESIIQAIMGHTTDSEMNKHYAANKDKRVTVLGESIALGMDIMGQVTDPSMIPLEFQQVQGGLVHNTAFLENIKDEEIRAEFEEVCDLVTAWIDDDEEEAKAKLLAKVEIQIPDPAKFKVRLAKHNAIKSYLSHIPFGFEFTFPSQAFTNDVRDEFKDIKEDLAKYFKGVSRVDGVMTPEIWSLPQVVFGNFRKMGATPSIAQSIVAHPVEYPMCPVATVKPKMQKPVVEKKAVVEIPNPRKRKEPEPSTVDDEWDFIPDSIEKGDIVVILCSKKDKFSFTLPNIPDKYVWIAKAVKYSPSTRNFTGVFMYNSTRNIKDPWQFGKKPERAFPIEDYDIMDILSPKIPLKPDGTPYEDDEEVDEETVSDFMIKDISILTDYNIKCIENMVKKVIATWKRE